jgi:hypothetical protein
MLVFMAVGGGEGPTHMLIKLEMTKPGYKEQSIVTNITVTDYILLYEGKGEPGATRLNPYLDLIR